MNTRTEGLATRQKGITGLETSIILIAFVVVASVFAFMILSAGVRSSEANKQTITAGLQETRTLLLQHGSAFAYQGKVVAVATVFKVQFIVSNSLAGEPIDLTSPHTADDTAIDPDIATANTALMIISYADENQRFPEVPWTVKFIWNNNNDLLLEDGEKVEITVWLFDRNFAQSATSDNSVQYMDTSTVNEGGVGAVTSTDSLIIKSTRFLVEVTPQQGGALTVQRTLPPGPLCREGHPRAFGAT